MSELEELKARAAERRHNWQYNTQNFSLTMNTLQGAEADLDRAIALLQTADEVGEAATRQLVEAKRERDKAIAAAKALRDDVRDIHMNILHQGLDCNEDCEVLADTAWLEEHANGK